MNRKRSRNRSHNTVMSSCIGWFFDVSIERDQVVIWIKTEDKKILRLRDSYRPSFYILPRNEYDGLCLFDYDCTDRKKQLICVQLRSIRYYPLLLKKLEKDPRVKQLYNTDLSHVQQYLFTKLRIEPTSKVQVEYDGSKILEIAKIDDEEEVSPPPFSLLYLDLHTCSGILASDDPIMMIKVRYVTDEKQEKEDILFQNSEEKTILQEFSNY